MTPKPRALLTDMLLEIQAINTLLRGVSLKGFALGATVQKVVEKRLHTLGRLADTLVGNFPTMAGNLRNVADIRRYCTFPAQTGDYSHETLWRAVKNDLPLLQTDVMALLQILRGAG